MSDVESWTSDVEDEIEFPTTAMLATRAREMAFKNIISIPCTDNDAKKEGKCPALKAWQRTTLSTEVDWSSALNIGHLTGLASGIVCLDIDSADQGMEIWARLCEKYGEPQAPKQSTPKDGLHYIFLYEEGVKLKSDSKCVTVEGQSIGIDLKTNGGMFIGYPSVNRINKKPYLWLRDPLTSEIGPMPAWVVKLLTLKSLDKNLDFIEPKPSELRVEAQPGQVIRRRTSENTDPKYLWELLDLVPDKYWQKYDAWLKLGMIIHAFFKGNEKDSFTVWNGFCKLKCENYDEPEVWSKIQSFKYDDSNLLGISSLEKIVAKCNPNKYVALKGDGKVVAQFSQEDKYCWFDLERDSKKIFESKDELSKYMINNLRRVLMKVTNVGYIRKNDNIPGKMFISYDRIDCKFSDSKIRYKGKTDDNDNTPVLSLSMKKLLSLYDAYVPIYKDIVCIPNYRCNNPDYFNIWQEYKARRLESCDITRIQPLLDLLKEVWCDNNEELYQYLLSWLYQLLITPEKKTKVALFVYSENQGCGKNTFTDFLKEFVIGRNSYTEYAGFEPVCQKHNADLEAKTLIVINEQSSTKGSFVANFDKMKYLISDDNITIEAKYKDSRLINNYSNFILFSNHSNCLYLENENDRRYLCLKASEAHMQDHAFFGDLRARCFNAECGDHFLTYFANMDSSKLKSLAVIPKTALKIELIEISQSNQIKFLTYVKNTRDLFPADRVSATVFFDSYINWCERSREKRNSSQTAFGLAIKPFIKKIRAASGYQYVISSISNKIPIDTTEIVAEEEPEELESGPVTTGNEWEIAPRTGIY
jgi:hypothetical protein